MIWLDVVGTLTLQLNRLHTRLSRQKFVIDATLVWVSLFGLFTQCDCDCDSLAATNQLYGISCHCCNHIMWTLTYYWMPDNPFVAINKLQWQSHCVKGPLKLTSTLKYEEEFLATYLDPRRIYRYLGSEKIQDVNLPIQLEGIKNTHGCWKSW